MQESQTDQVKQDLNIALILSLAFDFLMAFLLRSGITAIYGTGLSLLFYTLYYWRGELYTPPAFSYQQYTPPAFDISPPQQEVI